MEVRHEIFLIIIGCGLATLLPRVCPLIFLGRFSFPKWYQEWLSFIPVAIMTALVVQELMPENGNWSLSIPKLLACIIAFVAAFFTRSLFFTVLCGVLSIGLIHYFL